MRLHKVKSVGLSKILSYMLYLTYTISVHISVQLGKLQSPSGEAPVGSGQSEYIGLSVRNKVWPAHLAFPLEEKIGIGAAPNFSLPGPDIPRKVLLPSLPSGLCHPSPFLLEGEVGERPPHPALAELRLPRAPRPPPLPRLLLLPGSPNERLPLPHSLSGRREESLAGA